MGHLPGVRHTIAIRICDGDGQYQRNSRYRVHSIGAEIDTHQVREQFSGLSIAYPGVLDARWGNRYRVATGRTLHQEGEREQGHLRARAIDCSCPDKHGASCDWIGNERAVPSDPVDGHNCGGNSLVGKCAEVGAADLGQFQIDRIEGDGEGGAGHNIRIIDPDIDVDRLPGVDRDRASASDCFDHRKNLVRS
ncbi:MAG: hypothetical protein EOM93_07515 [Gammaproteobacteria bacterium]|nr:hypothetical protein [Gammaproteobacteria bacterium]